MSNGRSGNMGQKIDKKRAALMDSNEPHMEKAVQSNIPRTESSQNNAKCLDKFPITEHNEDLDIEEGQIITEEPNAEDSFRRRGVSQDAALTCNVKRIILSSENGSNVNKVIGGYDNQRILDTLAKMEKRRERFKEPIALKKEPGNSLNPEVDLIVDTDETKQQRPARKRRWGGS
jgi:pre-mRNA 3'-end-processing factor FIP1